MPITFGAKGAISYNTTSAAPTYPAGITAGDLLVMVVGVRDVGRNVLGGWNNVVDFESTFGTTGLRTGPTRVSIYAKIAVGGETGPVNTTNAGGSVMFGEITRWSSTTGEFYLETAFGEDATADVTFSAVCNPISRLSAGWVQPGDMLLAFSSKNTDSGAYSGASVSSPGLTIAAPTAISVYASALGNSIGGVSAYAQVTGGVQTSPDVTLAVNSSSSIYGPASVLRIRDSITLDPNYPTVTGTSFSRSTGGLTATVPVPVGIKNGDLLITGLGFTQTSILADPPSKGWFVLGAQVVNTRAFELLARIYNSSDPASTYTFTLNASAQVSFANVSLRNHGVSAASDIQLGTIYSRPASQSFTNAASLTTTIPNSFAMAFFGEATNALGAWTQTTGDFTLLVEQLETDTPSSGIEYSTFLFKRMPTPDATGNIVLDYTPASAANGWARQFVIPPVGSITPPSLTTTASGEISLGGSVTSLSNIVTEASGAIALAGSSVGIAQTVRTASGGVVLSGVGGLQSDATRSATGGVVLSGTATSSIKMVATASGGIVLSGTASTVLVLVRTADGQIALSGVGSLQSDAARVATGGITLSGSASVAIQAQRTAIGSLSLSGAATFESKITTIASGKVVLAGITVLTIKMIKTATGGIVLGGYSYFGNLPKFPDVLTLSHRPSRTLVSEDKVRRLLAVEAGERTLIPIKTEERKLLSVDPIRTLKGEPYGNNSER